MRDLAPILVSVYDRRWHLEQCIEGLKRNDLAKDSILYVVSDGSAKPEHDESVASVRAYIDQITGFKEVRKIYRPENWGAHRCCMAANNQVLAEHGRMIRMEDDVVCTKYYLQYLNQALDLYEDDPRIFSVCAYSYAGLKIPRSYPNDVFLWSRLSTWGYGIWKDRWKAVDFEMTRYPEFVADRSAVKRYRRIAPDSGHLEDDARGLIEATDSKMGFHMFLNNMYSVYPVHSLTKNIGNDGTGCRCGKSRRLQRQAIEDCPVVLTEHLEPNRAIHRRLYWSRFSFSVHVVGRVLRRLGVFDLCYRLYRRARGLRVEPSARSDRSR